MEILESLGENPKRHSACPCGSSRFYSSNFTIFEELFLARSWRLWWAIRRGRVAPPPTRADVAALRASLIAQVAALDEDFDVAPDGDFGMVQ